MEFSTQLPCGFVVSSEAIRAGLADAAMWQTLRYELSKETNECDGWKATNIASNKIEQLLEEEYSRAPEVVVRALVTVARAGGAKAISHYFSDGIVMWALDDETLRILIQYPELHDSLGHRRQGPRWLMQRLCELMAAGEIEWVEEAALTLGLDLYADPYVSCEEWMDFLNTFRSMKWLYDTVRIVGEPSSEYKRLAFETIQEEARKLWPTTSWRDLPNDDSEE